VQIREEIGVTFAAALRSFLRQDPNIILVGEVRDGETAEIAVKAALTGHLVLSTLHTNDAPSSFNRLIDMGMEPFLIASSIQLIAAQRLVRRVCVKCREPAPSSGEALIDIGFSPEDAENITVYRPAGCPDCNMSGYKGRVALYEVLPVSDGIREMVLNKAPTSELRAQARAEGMITLRESGLAKIWQGITTVEEVLRETIA
jgi:type IV pilus assembly protein PilB